MDVKWTCLFWMKNVNSGIKGEEENMKKMIYKFMIFSGSWIVVINFILLVCSDGYVGGKWKGLNKEYFAITILCCMIEMIIIIFGNCIFRYLYGTRELKIYSFMEGLALWKKYDWNDIKTIFPRVSYQVCEDSKKGNIIFGRWRGCVIAKPLNQQSGHVNVIASSGSGKTTKCIIPSIFNILSQNQKGDDSSFMAVDIKGELEAVTRNICGKKNIKCNYKVFNPNLKNCYGFNPYFILDGIEDNDDKIEVLEEIVGILIPISSQEKVNSFWLEGARAYLTGALWFYYEYKHLGFIDSIKNIARENPNDFATKVEMWNDRYIDIYYSDIYGYAKKREKALNYIFSEVKRNIQLFAVNRSIARVFSMPDEMCIRPEDLLTGTNIFLQFSEAKMPIYSKACGLIINMFIRYFTAIDESTQKIPNTAWLLDEFAQLPYMPAMDRCVSTIRSKGVTLVFCFQEPENQLREKYGRESAKIFMQNCTYNIIYGITGDSAEYFSREIGEYDRKVKSYTTGEKGKETISTRKERILSPQHFRDLKNKAKAVLISPYGYAYIDAMPWYQDKKWNS